MTRPRFSQDRRAVIVPDGPSIAWDPLADRPADWDGEGERLWEAIKALFGILRPDEPLPSTPTPTRRIAPLEFIERFTEAEQLAIVTATMSVPQVKLWYDKMLGAQYVDLDDAKTSGGLDALVGAGLLSAARKAEVLA